MTVIGFHASHEQIHPARLLRDVQHAETVELPQLELTTTPEPAVVS